MKQKIITLGILGGGQLGRMAALSASKIGIKTHIYCPEKNTPASQVTSLVTNADYTDWEELKKFVENVDFISYEFENIPIATARYIEKSKKLNPRADILDICQDRINEKTFFNAHNIETTRWKKCASVDDIRAALTTWKTQECIIKTTRFGYDGKGQYKQRDEDNIFENFLRYNGRPLVIEEIVDFSYEASILVVRDVSGKTVLYPLTINEHKNHILSKSSPSDSHEEISKQAHHIAKSIADSLRLVGILAIELFVTKDGRVVANEMAPRPHNSGHWTMDGCDVSQFDNYVRAVCGLPVLPPRQHSDVTMINLIGDDVGELDQYYDMEGACVHLYGKEEARAGRKMGHVNIVKPLKN